MSDLSSDSNVEPSAESGTLPLPLMPLPIGDGAVPPPRLEDRVRPTPARAEREIGQGRNRRNGRGGKRGNRGNNTDSRRLPASGQQVAATPQAVQEEAAPAADLPALSVVPSATFDSDGCTWIARISGVSASGRGRPGTGAPLSLVTFARQDDPDHPVCEALMVGRGLDGLSEETLSDLLSRARPTPPTREREDIFSDTRARKKADKADQ